MTAAAVVALALCIVSSVVSIIDIRRLRREARDD